jgi:hypothetical protein
MEADMSRTGRVQSAEQICHLASTSVSQKLTPEDE